MFASENTNTQTSSQQTAVIGTAIVGSLVPADVNAQSGTLLVSQGPGQPATWSTIGPLIPGLKSRQVADFEGSANAFLTVAKGDNNSANMPSIAVFPDYAGIGKPGLMTLTLQTTHQQVNSNIDGYSIQLDRNIGSGFQTIPDCGGFNGVYYQLFRLIDGSVRDARTYTYVWQIPTVLAGTYRLTIASTKTGQPVPNDFTGQFGVYAAELSLR
jgi:hypothetical protein